MGTSTGNRDGVPSTDGEVATNLAAGADDPAPSEIPDLSVTTLGTPKVASPMAPLLDNR